MTQTEYTAAQIEAARTAIYGLADQPREVQVATLCAVDGYLIAALYGKPATLEPTKECRCSALSPDEAPPGASDLEADLWWLHGRLPISISAHESGRLFLATDSRYDHKSLMFSPDGKVATIKVMESLHKTEQRELRAKWTPHSRNKAWVSFPDEQAPWDALYAFLSRHPAPRLRW